MQIKRMLWALLAETVAWLLLSWVAGYLNLDNLIVGSGGTGGRHGDGWEFSVDFQAILLLCLFIAWLTTIYKNLYVPMLKQ